LQALVFASNGYFIHQFATKKWVIRWVIFLKIFTHQKSRKELIYKKFNRWTSCLRLIASLFLFHFLMLKHEN